MLSGARPCSWSSGFASSGMGLLCFCFWQLRPMTTFALLMASLFSFSWLVLSHDLLHPFSYISATVGFRLGFPQPLFVIFSFSGVRSSHTPSLAAHNACPYHAFRLEPFSLPFGLLGFFLPLPLLRRLEHLLRLRHLALTAFLFAVICTHAPPHSFCALRLVFSSTRSTLPTQAGRSWHVLFFTLFTLRFLTDTHSSVRLAFAALVSWPGQCPRRDTLCPLGTDALVQLQAFASARLSCSGYSHCLPAHVRLCLVRPLSSRR